MEQHPIPQNISSYEFKLVGEMTLKQFGKAAAGIILALVVNATKIIFFIKWPLMGLLAGGGLVMAFVPIEDRPLETWMAAFIRSIYSPTIYLYKKRSPSNWLDIDKTKVIEEEESSEEGSKPVKDGGKVEEFIQSLPSVKRETGRVKPRTEEDREEMEAVLEGMGVREGVKKEEIKEEPIKAEQISEKKMEDWSGGKPELKLKTTRLEATGKAVFGSIPMPDVPEAPNMLVGMVTNREGKIVEGAIVEVQDQKGNPARVLKTNQLGQFKTSAQLANGRYLMVTEKEGLEFDRVNVDLSGAVVQPIRIIGN